MKDWQWRPYQINCFEAIFKGFDNGINTQLIKQATGLGKRSQAVYMAGKTRKSLFLAHNEELIGQAYEDFANHYGFLNVGIIKGPRMEIDKRFVIASPQTLYNRLDRISKDEFSLVQVDECHHYLAKTYCQSVTHFNAKRIGWTATDRRLDGLSLMDLFEEKTFEYNIREGIQDGFLCELDGIRIKTEIGLDGVARKGGDFNEQQLGNVVNTPGRNNLIVQSYLKYSKDRPFIAFCVNTQHATDLAGHFEDIGIHVGIISSDKNLCSDDDRKTRIIKFKNHSLQGLIGVSILTEGFDHNDVGCILMARPTQSEVLYFQAIGRGTRLKSDWFFEKFGIRNCMILDFVDNTSRHKLVNSFEVDRSLKADYKIFVTEEKREKLLDAEKQRREITIKTVVKEDTRLNLLDLPPVKIFSSPAMHDNATDKQIDFLKNLGVYAESDSEGNQILYTKLMATEIINAAPIDSRMKRSLLHWGYNPENASVGQYMIIYNREKMKGIREGNKFVPVVPQPLILGNYE
jgi:superfamily II DNA or RNA helicase